MASDHYYRDDWDGALDRILAESPFRPRHGGSPEDLVLDLNMVVRQIIARISRDRKWSQNEAARQMGLQQRSLGRFMAGAGMGLDSLTKVIAGLDTDAIAFFRSHPAVGGQRAQRMKAVRDQVVDAFRTTLNPSERKELVELIDESQRLGVYQRAVDAFEGAVKTARQASRARRRSRKIKTKKS